MTGTVIFEEAKNFIWGQAPISMNYTDSIVTCVTTGTAQREATSRGRHYDNGSSGPRSYGNRGRRGRVWRARANRLFVRMMKRVVE